MEFDFKKLVATAFDYVGPIYPGLISQNLGNFSYPDLMEVGSEIFLGKRFFTTLTLAHDGNEFTLPNEPLLSVSLSKTIVETATVGKKRRGTVKEYITVEDYQITIRGVCFDEKNPERYPSEQVKMINDLFEIHDSVEVVGNKFFELFKIRHIVLRDKNFDEMAGQQGLQKYTITAVSDTDFYADLNERETFLNS